MKPLLPISVESTTRHKLIRSFKREIGQLSNLQDLDLGENQLTQLPREIGQLSHLQHLWLMRNPLTPSAKKIILQLNCNVYL